MTAMLETAFAEAAKLSAQEQDDVAAWLLDELASERRWKKTFAQSSDLLGILADEALSEYRTGQTRPLTPEQL